MTYLSQTLSSLIQNTNEDERKTVTVVVFLADLRAEYNAETAESLQKEYSEHIDSGFVRLLRVKKEYYPPLENLKRNFNDKPERVRWRAKQVADFALMFMYSQNLSDYYVQIEDDVICSRNFVSAIRDYIDMMERNLEKEHWAMLEFSELGFIGKLFRSDDLSRLARFMLMFYEEQPVDWLMSYFRMSMGQRNVFMRKPTLFQHIGLKSSFDITKDNTLRDKYFDSGDKPWSPDNPPATIISSMPFFKDHPPDLSYNSGSGYFWATKVVAGDYIYVLFKDDQHVKSLIVETGNEKNPTDKLDAGTVYLSQKVIMFDEKKGTVNCGNMQWVANFTDGRAETQSLETVVTWPVSCIKISVNNTQKKWVAFTQIAVFVVKK